MYLLVPRRKLNNKFPLFLKLQVIIVRIATQSLNAIVGALNKKIKCLIKFLFD